MNRGNENIQTPWARCPPRLTTCDHDRVRSSLLASSHVVRQSARPATDSPPRLHTAPNGIPATRVRKVPQLRIVRSSQEESSRPNVIAATASGSRPRLLGPNGLFAWGGPIKIESDSLGVAAPRSVGCHDRVRFAVDWTQDLIAGVKPRRAPTRPTEVRREGDIPGQGNVEPWPTCVRSLTTRHQGYVSTSRAIRPFPLEFTRALREQVALATPTGRFHVLGKGASWMFSP